jgi:hypothetical protein
VTTQPDPSGPVVTPEQIVAEIDEWYAYATPGFWRMSEHRGGTWRHHIEATQEGATAYQTVASMRNPGCEWADVALLIKLHNHWPRIRELLCGKEAE